ncbi:hypothetical protein J7431_21635 [Xanthomonas phaseoli pv. dieffenbachiae]|uniref:hypothetical protein n=1 Tax=Xanthomonas TaxID=338 RepID=UPI00111C5BE8|nr:MULTISPECIES: hypothetical protein [Xanthomonas]MBO9749750.1 hypothetical protein [Xanthomonas phaseoli pv. dieffenbachiae]MBO9753865.1 hypothetical protein [Xanthomonas phaseoli pv. dieffenbachiae]MBO9891607.1 hypothetical protein [Xanthomonas sp. D-36-1]
MAAFSEDFRGALNLAHRICAFSTEHDPGREGMQHLLAWQGYSFEAFFDSNGAERIEEQLDSLAEKNPDHQTAVTLLKAETTAVRSHLDWLTGRLSDWRRGAIWPGTRQPALTVLRGQSKRGMGLLATLLNSLSEILADLVPGLKAVLDAVKEAIEHFAK